MTQRSLHLAKDLALPLDFATKTAAILAQRRKGKTYLASVIAEEMVAAKQPFVALDPTGAWWGLRASADGKQAGLPVVVLGGQHGDVPLERTGGKLIADLVVDEPGYYVIDFSLFESGEAERQFAVDFAERLYRAKAQPGRDFPLHLFVDEADRFIPQQMRKGSGETSPRLLGAFEAIVRRGGLRGLGTTLISQRAAVVNKNVLEMLDVLFALRTVGPNDRAAVEEYIEAHGTDVEKAEMMGSLATLEIGEAWIWEPGAEPPLFQRVQIRRRKTFNSSATPKAGEKRVEPRRLADVDLAALQKRMADTIEKAKAEDPRELRRRIGELEQQVRSPKSQVPSPKVVDKPVLTDADRALLEKLTKRFDDLTAVRRASEFLIGIDAFKRSLDEYTQRLINVLSAEDAKFLAALDSKGFQKILGKLSALSPQPAAQPFRAATPRQPQRGRANPGAPAASPGGSRNGARPAGDGSLAKGERIVLTALAQRPAGVSRETLTALTGYKRSTRDVYLQQLARQGFIEDARGQVRITAAGAAALGDFEALPTGAELAAYWLNKLPEGERRILKILVDARGAAVDRETIGEQSGYKRSTRDLYLQQLARRMIIANDRDGIRASEELFS